MDKTKFELWAVIVKKQIHCCVGSFSSADVWVERPLTTNLADIFEDCEISAHVDFKNRRVTVYVESDETFYERALKEPGGLISFDKHPDYLAHVQGYLEQGWTISNLPGSEMEERYVRCT